MSHEYAWYAGGDNGTKLMHTRQDILCEEKEERERERKFLSVSSSFRDLEYANIRAGIPFLPNYAARVIFREICIRMYGYVDRDITRQQ